MTLISNSPTNDEALEEQNMIAKEAVKDYESAF